MKNNHIRIGTRGSKLALYQAERVKQALEEQFSDIKVELIVIQSKGDKILDVALSKIGDKGLFTKELEDAMFRDEIDLAVHSLKDLPTTLPEGLKIGAVLPRGEVRDALVSAKGIKLNDLTPQMKIATSSLRRKAQLLKINSEFNIVDIRGNVNTRIRKMEEGYCDVMLMAAAGLQRVGLDNYISEIIDADIIIPAVSQGAMAVESKIDDVELDKFLAKINDKLTYDVTEAERVFLKKLEGGCQIPIGCFSELNGDTITMNGYMSYTDGTSIIQYTASKKLIDAKDLAHEMADYFIDKGSVELLDRIRKHNDQ